MRTVREASRRQFFIDVLRSLLSCFSPSAHRRNRIQGPMFVTFVELKSAAIFWTHLKWTRRHKLAMWGSRFWPHFLGTQSRQWMTRLCAHGRAHMGQRQGIRSQDRAVPRVFLHYTLRFMPRGVHCLTVMVRRVSSVVCRYTVSYTHLTLPTILRV